MVAMNRTAPATAAASLLLAIVSTAIGQPATAPSADGFVDLFNGHDLSGWRTVNGAPGTWTARHGWTPLSR